MVLRIRSSLVRNLAGVSRRRLLLTILLILSFPTGSFLFAQSTPLHSLPATIVADTLSIEFPYAIFLTSEDSLSLLRGEEITLICRLELWQKRKLWFDKMRQSVTRAFKLSFNRWEEKFSLEYLDDYGWKVSKHDTILDSLLIRFARWSPYTFKLEGDDFTARSSVAYSIEVKYLTLQKVGEIGRWLRGGEKNDTISIGSADDGSFAGKLLRVALKTAGFKNRSETRASETFLPDTLSGEIFFP